VHAPQLIKATLVGSHQVADGNTRWYLMSALRTRGAETDLIQWDRSATYLIIEGKVVASLSVLTSTPTRASTLGSVVMTSGFHGTPFLSSVGK